MTPPAERTLFDGPVGDFDWGPHRRWRSTAAARAPVMVAVLGALLLTTALMLLLGP